MQMLCVCVQEDYPHSPPIWFSESDDAVLSTALEKLSETSPQNNNVHMCLCLIMLQLQDPL